MVDICGGSGGGKSGGGRSGGSSEAGTNGDAGQPGEVVRQANAQNEKAFAAYVDRNDHQDALDDYRAQRIADRLHIAIRTDENGNIIGHRVISNKAKIADKNAKYAPYGKTREETVKNMRKALYG